MFRPKCENQKYINEDGSFNQKLWNTDLHEFIEHQELRIKVYEKHINDFHKENEILTQRLNDEDAKFWKDIYTAYVNSSNSARIDAGSFWADLALKKFKEKFNTNTQNNG